MLLLELLMAGAVAAAPQTSAPKAAPAAKVVLPVQINLGRLPRCDGREFLHVADKAQPPEAKRLGDLPMANLERTVNRTVNGCVKPAVVSYSVGK